MGAINGSGPQVGAGRRPWDAHQRGTFKQEDGGAPATDEQFYDLVMGILECPPARPILERFGIIFKQNAQGVLRPHCAKCESYPCTCIKEGMTRENLDDLAVAMYEDPVIQEKLFKPLGITVDTGERHGC